MKKIRLPQFDFSAFASGLMLPFQGARFLVANRGLKRYAMLPLVMNILLYGAAIFIFLHFLWGWNIYLVSWDFLGPIGRWLAAAVNWMGWLVKLIIAMFALGVAFFTFTAVGMTLASPLNDILSEKVEMAYLGGSAKIDLPFRFTVRAGIVSFLDSLRNLVRQLAYTVLALPFLLIPVVGFVPLFLVGGYFAGFGFIDTAMARNYLRPQHKKIMTGKKYWEIIGFGAAMQVIFTIPFLGMLLMPVGVVSGTLLYCREDWEKLLAESGVALPKGFIPPRRCENVQTSDRTLPG